MDFKYIVDTQSSGRTVKSILKNEFMFSHNLIKKFKYHGKVFSNHAPVYMNHVVKTGDVVEAHINFIETSENIKSVRMDLSVLFEDESIIALDKPSGIIIHPTGTTTESTIANGLMHHYESNGKRIKVRPVSRLDRDTTGVIVFAKNQFVQEKLINQMKINRYHKEYIGFVHGCPSEASGTINLPIARTPGSIIHREVSASGSPSVTHYTVIAYYKNAARMRFLLETGRTHQIRVHSLAIGHPLLGDTLYSNTPASIIDRQALHSHIVRFSHPLTGKDIEITAPLPEDILNLMKALK